MDQYRITFGIEPTDKYIKAKQDLVTALQSFDELSDAERECLLQEVLGTANYVVANKIFKLFSGGKL